MINFNSKSNNKYINLLLINKIIKFYPSYRDVLLI